MVPATVDYGKLAPEVADGVRLLPVVHDSADMGAVVRAVIETLQPCAIALELPTTFEKHVQRAVRRLPEISLILSVPEGEEALVWTVTPAEPFAVAARWAQENDRPMFCIDPDIRYVERHVDPVPDTHAIWTLGPADFLSTIAELCGDSGASADDRRREQGMAYHIQTIRKKHTTGPVLVLVGAAHAHRLAEDINSDVAQPLARVRRTQIEVRHVHPDSLTALLSDPPLVHACYETLHQGVPSEAPEIDEASSQRISLQRGHLQLISRGADATPRERRKAAVAYACFHSVRDLAPGFSYLDRSAVARAVWHIATHSYQNQTLETVAGWQKRLFFDYSRRQARVQGRLLGGLYEWVVSARGVADDNLAWEVFAASSAYPWQGEESDAPVVRIDGDELDLGTRKVRFRRRFFRVKKRPVRIPVRERPETDNPDEWLRGFNSDHIVSYPPEDIVLEDYGRFLQKKAVSILSAERSRSEPFSASMLDGIDIRETMRNVHDGRIYVQERGRVKGEAGSVVVIFDPDVEGTRYPHMMTWLGEHDQESDMAFYTTNPMNQIVGPGIMRATYGGFMLSWPRMRLFDVWADPDYRLAQSKPDVLLMAAVDYSVDTIVVHVAEKPPSSAMHTYASRRGKKITYIPLGSLSTLALKKLRVVHILSGPDKRSIVKDYLW
ncbi:MAG: hypothetical protein CMH54_15740 [Myxococcales bacterium]|nr:hypothetical protein [Myxococcales bacterium]